ncbi:uridylate kinase [Trichomonascus vanleenenianus]|uniref:uridylate kinase n=1 Tax=Trichomonascus vanleenenianus TaxID=2268995 RepID=UPI003ECA066D
MLGRQFMRFARQGRLQAGKRFYSNQARQDPPKLRYIALVALVGTGAFMLAANSLDRKSPKTQMSEEEYEQLKQNAKMRYKRSAFSSDDVSVIFVLGGPGAGKGTQCENIVRDYDFVHLSAGDLLREEQKNPESQYGELIDRYIREGLIVPQEITIALLQNAMKKAIAEKGINKFLIDGFPRKMDQAVKFEEDVAVSKFTLFFECPEQVMLQRLLKRGQNSGRTDDNIESIKKRFRVFEDTSMPVVNYFATAGKVVRLSCERTPEEVYSDVQKALASHGMIKKIDIL